MIDQIRKIRPATFGFTVFCFLLPFLTVSCPGGQYTFSGVDLVTGTTLDDQALPPELLAITALLLALAGGAVTLMKPEQHLPAGLLGLGAALSLILMQQKIRHDILSEGGGLVQVSFSAGYYLALLGVVLATAFSYLLHDAERSAAQQPASSTPPPDVEPETTAPEPAE